MIIQEVHEDWYEDGVEDGENLWRLDFSYGKNEYQAQLFCEAPPGTDDGVADDDSLDYSSARLFIERDNRLEGGARWDYACGTWPLNDVEAVSLLKSDTVEAIVSMMDKVRQVEKMPNDRDFIRRWARPSELPRIEEYWAKLDGKIEGGELLEGS